MSEDAELRLAHHLTQGGLLALSAAAIALVNLGGTPLTHLAGNVLGLMAQPLWLYSTWRSREWGIFILALVYLAIWCTGIARHF